MTSLKCCGIICLVKINKTLTGGGYEKKKLLNVKG
nr:MAG TPA: hypothetical protein [Caudoviricetes sp.]